MKNLCKAVFRFAVLSSLIASARGMHAQMVSPSIDHPDQPFSYFSKPTDEMGMMDAEAATEITPEGYLRTGFGELMFFAVPSLRRSTFAYARSKTAICRSSTTACRRDGISTTSPSLAHRSTHVRRQAAGFWPLQCKPGQLRPRRDQERSRRPHACRFCHRDTLRCAQ